MHDASSVMGVWLHEEGRHPLAKKQKKKENSWPLREMRCYSTFKLKHCLKDLFQLELPFRNVPHTWFRIASKLGLNNSDRFWRFNDASNGGDGQSFSNNSVSFL